MLQNMLLVFVAQALFDHQRAHTPTQLPPPPPRKNYSAIVISSLPTHPYVKTSAWEALTQYDGVSFS